MRDGAVPACVGLVLVLALLSVGVGPSHADSGDPSELTAEDVKLVSISENGTARLWPYTSRKEKFSTLTLPINVIVREDAGTTRRVLAGTAKWETSDPEGEAVVINGTGVSWAETEGATRYTYVQTASGGEWLTEAYQLHDGTYLGRRTHLRLYEGGGRNDSWTAVQAHTEYWDWFRLRHSVGSVAKGQYAVERDLYGTGLIDGVRRERYANGGVLDADGWVTVVDLVDWKVRPTGATGASGTGEPVAARDPSPFAPTVLSPVALGLAMAMSGQLATAGRTVGRTVVTDRVTRHHVGLFLALALVLPAVRATSVALEQQFFAHAPKLVAAPMYLVLALGIPAAAVAFGSRLAADDGFVVAVVALGLGILLDYLTLGVQTLPVGVLIHRVVLVFAIGLVAAGGTRWAEDPLLRHGYRVPGLFLWAVALIWPLAGL
jgi:hypothetical protein